ncbi:cache domain-containing sensor histidine kinase [Anaerotalea alkaliphila]|uniref:histidine kinase n=1 Tax=Anaerotalea alkaliphila TaxID=2662126 RepID=A0A7X5KN09_9FIRM|nr:histidine kinase [Anaerotalea alkaliphila]NDL67278.1 sensor histidine kinase [Anaerotalea alkaliphila]
MGWKFKSIRARLLATLLLAVGIPVLLSSMFLYGNTRRTVLAGTISETEKLLNAGKSNIEAYFALIDKASLEIYGTKYKDSSIFSLAKKSYGYDTELFVLQTLYSIYGYDPDILQVYFHLQEHQKAFLFKENMIARGDAAGNQLSPLVEDARLTSVHESTDYGIPHMVKSQGPVVSFQRNIYDIPTRNILATVSIDLKASVFQRLSADLFDPDMESLVWVSLPEGRVLYDSKGERTGSLLDQGLLARAMASVQEGKGNFHWREGGQNNLVVVDTVANGTIEHLLMKEIPDHRIQSAVNELVEFALVNVLVTGLMIVLVSVLLSYHFSRPIGELLGTISRIRAGNLETTIPVRKKGEEGDEFDLLKDHFNEMMDSINRQIHLQYRLGLENTRNELKALQAQINSHFMNNILQSIGTEALKEGNRKVYRLIVQLGNMMQYSMRNQNQIVPLEAELDYCRSYLELQNHRFEGRIDHEVQAEEGVLSLPIPKVTLQPVLENCFIHGFGSEGEGGRIRIRCSRSGDRFQVEVEDNGTGIPPEKMAELNRMFRMSVGKETEEADALSAPGRIGLANVHRRLLFYYKGKGNLTILPGKEGGTSVLLDLPVSPLLEESR